MSTYRTKRPAAARTRRTQQPKQKDLAKYLTLDYVERALAVIDHRLARNDVRTAQYVLEMYFGKPRAVTPRLEQPHTPANKKPSIRLTTKFLDKLAQKYFPKPDWNPQQSTSYRAGEELEGKKPEVGE